MGQLVLRIPLARPRRPEPQWQPGIPVHPVPEPEGDPGDPPPWETEAMHWTAEPVELPREVGRSLLAHR